MEFFGRSLIVALLLASTASTAQDYPTRPVRVVVPFPAGIDAPARIAAEKLSQALGGSWLVDNKSGAGGSIASAAVASAAPDGYTLLVNSSALTMYPAVYSNLTFDPAKDLIPIATICEVPLVMVVSADKNWRSVKDLIAYARSKPGVLTYGTAGSASTTHLAFERLRSEAKFDGVHVPFKGSNLAVAEILAGRVDVGYTTIAGAQAGIQSKRLIALAMSGKRRSSLLPEVPTIIEAGFANSDFTVWMGLFAPAKTPQPIVDRLSEELLKALVIPANREQIIRAGLEPLSVPMEQFQAMFQSEFTINQALAKAAGLKP